MRCKPFFLSLLIFIFLSTYSPAQLWTGILSSGRAVDWSNAGIPGALPDVNWTQCGATIAPYSGSGSTISNAIANCGANQYVQLAAGTFNLSSGISFNQKSNVVLRGMGANQTFLNFSGNGAGNFGSVIAMEGSPSFPNSGTSGSYEQNVCDWTAGYAQGATTITLSNCGHSKPASGNVSSLVSSGPNQTVLILDQLDDLVDTGTIWNCFQTFTDVPSGMGVCGSEGSGDGNPGFIREDGPCYGVQCHRSQEQTVLVTGVSSCGANCATVTISPGLYMPNWNYDNHRLPQGWWATTPISQEGLENLSINNKPDSGQNPFSSTVDIDNCYRCWVHGVRSLYASRSHIIVRTSKNVQIDSNYLFEDMTHQIVSYGIEFNNTSDSAAVNNFGQQVTANLPTCSGPCSGMFFGYNYTVDSVYSSSNNWMLAMNSRHSGGTAMNLDEGNVTTTYEGDNVHGTHHFETAFRNYFSGWAPTCFGGTCAADTSPINLAAGSRYFNIVGNVLGQPGFHNAYQCIANPTCSPGNHQIDTSVFGLGADEGVGGCPNSGSYPCPGADSFGFCSSPACSSHVWYDPQVTAYLLRWGNYDVVTGAARWCGTSSNSGWSSTCSNSSEIPTSLASYANPVPTRGDTEAGQPALPASFYYSSQPGFMTTTYGTVPWPPIGPDVTGGNVPGLAGHANEIPAQLVFMKTPVDSNFQVAYSFTSSSWSGGVETLTFAGGTWNAAANCTPIHVPICIPVGEIRIPSGPLAGTYQVTQSTPNTVSFALASNPGNVTGTMLYPNVRLFTASAYGAMSNNSGPTAPTGLKAVVH